MLRLVLAESGALSQASLLPIFIGLVVLELSLPLWLEREAAHQLAPASHRRTLRTVRDHPPRRMHPRRVVQGRDGDRGRGRQRRLVTIAVAGLVVIFALWWLYFLEPAGTALARNPDRAFLWGCFGQYGVFAALAGLGAGLEVAIEQTGNQIRLSPIAVSYAVAIPVGVFLVLLWAVSAIIVGRSVIRPVVILFGAAVILLVPLSAAGHRCGCRRGGDRDGVRFDDRGLGPRSCRLPRAAVAAGPERSEGAGCFDDHVGDRPSVSHHGEVGSVDLDDPSSSVLSHRDLVTNRHAVIVVADNRP